MKIDTKKMLYTKSGKVKSVDFHPTFPWILIGLFSGSINIYDYNTQACLQYMEVTSHPIRCAKFISEKNWFVCGADDKKIRVYNYNTMEKIREFEAHSDFIRNICINSKETQLLSCSDDQTICLWDIDKFFSLIRTYDEHKNFVMKLALNPKDPAMFASCSMDSKVKIWSFNGNNSHLTLEGHAKGVSVIAFCSLIDKSYLASGSDDKTIKLWDYTNKHCVFTFEGHEENISSLCFHPELPILISGAEDTTCKFWNINSFKLEDSKLFGYETLWDISSKASQNAIAFGCEEGTIVLRMGSDQPLATFNNSGSNAKIIYAKQNAIFAINLKQLTNEIKDGEVIDTQPKSLGSTELFPLGIKFSPNGKFFSVISDREFVISTAGIYRSSCVGSSQDIAWIDNSSSDFIIKDGHKLVLYKNLQEFKNFKPGFAFENIFGGPFFAIRSSDSLFIYDFETQIFLRKIDVLPNNIIWSENKKNLALICDDMTYIIKVNLNKIEKFIEEKDTTSPDDADDEGCEEGFDADCELNDKIVSGLFIEEVFIYITSKNKINYVIDGKVFSITSLNANYSLLGYLAGSNRLFLMNKNFDLISYVFPLSFVSYQICIFKKDFQQAEKILQNIPNEYLVRVTNFLEKFNHYDLSYNITTDPNQKFTLAIRLKKLKDARVLALQMNSAEKWKMVADLAIELGEFKHAEEAMVAAKDYQGLLLYYSLIKDPEKISLLGDNAEKDGLFNIAFSCWFQLNDTDKCLEILIKNNKIPEAALFCRTYCPSKLNSTLALWNEKINNEELGRIHINVINPLDNFPEKKIEDSEKIINEYYDLVRSSHIEDNNKLIHFLDYDLESHPTDSKLDLKALLEID